MTPCRALRLPFTHTRMLPFTTPFPTLRSLPHHLVVPHMTNPFFPILLLLSLSTLYRATANSKTNTNRPLSVLRRPPDRPSEDQRSWSNAADKPFPHLLRAQPPKAPSRHPRRASRSRDVVRHAALRIRLARPVGSNLGNEQEMKIQRDLIRTGDDGGGSGMDGVSHWGTPGHRRLLFPLSLIPAPFCTFPFHTKA